MTRAIFVQGTLPAASSPPDRSDRARAECDRGHRVRAGGVYVRFPAEDAEIARLLTSRRGELQHASQEAFEIITEIGPDGQRFVRPRFVSASYLNRTRIPPGDVKAISDTLVMCG
jgi:hypothetical protein